ncbi:MAG: DeoR/GlpR transcriptional regulator [Ruminococcaceae bacterium]|nr:DeoR/GlpR transcriptional regulator [Oscillospiraceae bacterium]
MLYNNTGMKKNNILMREGDKLQDRRLSIFELIEQQGEISIHELETLFPDVSSMTLRRDLDYLESKNKIVKIKGGAKSLSHLSRSLFQDVEGDYGLRESINAAGKHLIAEKATPLIESGRSIYIDAGSTIMQFVRYLKTGRFSVITNGVNAALELSQNQSATVNLVGGELNRNNMSVSGGGALEHIRNINIDIAFMAASGFTVEDGFSNGSFDEFELKREVVKKAKKTVILMDSTKLGKTMPYTFCTLADVDYLIMDQPADAQLLAEAKKTGTIIL